MKMSYKIALIVSVVACILAFAVFKGKSQPEPTQAANTPTDQAPAPAERKNLRADSKGDGSLKSMVNAITPASTNGTAGSLASDARNRVLASLNKESPGTDPQEPKTADSSQAGDATSTSPLGNGASAAIALARTETATNTTDATPKPATNVSHQDLDAVFGSTDHSDRATPVKTLTIGATTDANAQPTTAKSEADTPETYIVQPDDTFSSIAVKLYNDELRWADVAQANPEVEPTRLKIGQVLRLPGAERLADEETVLPGPGGLQTYTIKPGDSLSTVAQQFYDDPTLWRTIYNFNRDTIGENPNAIQAGMPLKIPPTIKGAR